MSHSFDFTSFSVKAPLSSKNIEWKKALTFTLVYCEPRLVLGFVILLFSCYEIHGIFLAVSLTILLLVAYTKNTVYSFVTSLKVDRVPRPRFSILLYLADWLLRVYACFIKEATGLMKVQITNGRRK